jgi:hypothetical protein
MKQNDIKRMAIEAGVIFYEDENLFWTENDAVEALTRFAQLIVDRTHD